MNLSQFYESLSTIFATGQWKVYAITNRKLRIHPVDDMTAEYCPVTLVAYAQTGQQYTVGQVSEAAMAINLNSKACACVIRGADYRTSIDGFRNRKKLLIAMRAVESTI